jgi:IS30 family transposase
MRKQGISISAIAMQLGVHRSTLYRELQRNSKQYVKRREYNSLFAQHLTDKRHQLKKKHIQLTEPVRRRIRWLIRCYWSPEQIVQTCKNRGIDMVSVETVYLYLYDLKKQGTDLCIYLRRHHRKRRKRKLDKQPRTLIKDKVSIEQRPAMINKKERIGDFEVDLMKAKNGYLLTLTERKTLFNIIEKLPNKKAAQIEAAMNKIAQSYRLLSVTSDNGLEFAHHQKVALPNRIKWYFAHPYSSHERGCNENQNGLIRQFITRKTDLNKVTDEDVKTIQNRLNNRPRKKNGFIAPKHLFLDYQSVALVT